MVKRIRDYAVEYINVCGVSKEVVRHKGCLNDLVKTHLIEPIVVKSLKLIIYDSVKDVSGYSEPAISRFEAYLK